MLRWMGTALVVALLAGCISWQEDAARMRQENAARLDSYMEEAVINGILAERTMYPYHFHHNTPELTELGKRNLAVLAAHHGQYPGPLNIRQGGASDGLYRARVNTVREHLDAWGIAIGDAPITNTVPGGDGIRSSRLFEMHLPADASATMTTGEMLR